MKKKHLGIHMNPDLHYKMKYISLYKNRSLSKQIIQSLQDSVASYEQEHGEIELPKEVIEEMVAGEDDP